MYVSEPHSRYTGEKRSAEQFFSLSTVAFDTAENTRIIILCPVSSSFYAFVNALTHRDSHFCHRIFLRSSVPFSRVYESRRAVTIARNLPIPVVQLFVSRFLVAVTRAARSVSAPIFGSLFSKYKSSFCNERKEKRQIISNDRQLIYENDVRAFPLSKFFSCLSRREFLFLRGKVRVESTYTCDVYKIMARIKLAAPTIRLSVSTEPGRGVG